MELRNDAPEILPGRNKNIYPHKDISVIVHISIIHNRPNIKPIAYQGRSEWAVTTLEVTVVSSQSGQVHRCSEVSRMSLLSSFPYPALLSSCWPYWPIVVPGLRLTNRQWTGFTEALATPRPMLPIVQATGLLHRWAGHVWLLRLTERLFPRSFMPFSDLNFPSPFHSGERSDSSNKSLNPWHPQ